MTLLDFVRDLAHHLELGTRLPWEECRSAIGRARQGLEEIYAGYQQVPAGAQSVAQLMRESLQLYDAALARLEAYPQARDPEQLVLALKEAHEAEDLLATVEYEVACSQEELRDHQRA